MSNVEQTMTAGWVHPPTVEERMSAGRSARRTAPRSVLSRTPSPERDPLGILSAQNAKRVPDLVPLRIERMSQSPFAFYRGTAALMAADLASTPHSGILVASCGDAHVSNFGFYASPQRTLMFDLNDFDEAAWAPWEWDLKRLITSVVIGGQAAGRDERVVRDAALDAVRAYARAITVAASMSPTERYFSHFDAESTIANLDGESRRALKSAIATAEKRTADRAVRKMTRLDDRGRFEFIERPPTLTRVSPELAKRVEEYIYAYIETAAVDIAVLLANYVTADVARRVVGVGSVGTRCHLIALQSGDDHALLLQSKEAGQSVLVEHGKVRQPPALTAHIAAHGEGGRVVAMQRTLQAFSDPFLGHLRADGTDLYVRQFHDMKGGVEIELLEDEPFSTYAQACAVTLARAHAQSTTAPQVAGYIGNGRLVGEALLEWAYDYAALSRRDFDAFVAANAG